MLDHPLGTSEVTRRCSTITRLTNFVYFRCSTITRLTNFVYFRCSTITRLTNFVYFRCSTIDPLTSEVVCRCSTIAPETSEVRLGTVDWRGVRTFLWESQVSRRNRRRSPQSAQPSRRGPEDVLRCAFHVRSGAAGAPRP